MPDNESRYVSRGDRQTVAGTLEPGLRLGKLELATRLGRGGLGKVWKAFDPAREGFVALKFLPPIMQQSPRKLRRM
jgi:serine/threonine protein kinase